MRSATNHYSLRSNPELRWRHISTCSHGIWALWTSSSWQILGCVLYGQSYIYAHRICVTQSEDNNIEIVRCALWCSRGVAAWDATAAFWGAWFQSRLLCFRKQTTQWILGFPPTYETRGIPGMGLHPVLAMPEAGTWGLNQWMLKICLSLPLHLNQKVAVL